MSSIMVVDRHARRQVQAINIKRQMSSETFVLRRSFCAILIASFTVVAAAACEQPPPTALLGESDAPEYNIPAVTPSAMVHSVISEAAPTAYCTSTTIPEPPPTTGAPTLTPLPPFRMCSPLMEHSLADLQEIVSFPYDPPPPGKDTGHHGVDFAYYRRGDRGSILGTPIQSVLQGRVTTVVLDRPPYGYMIIVETPASGLPDDLIALLEMQNGESLYLLYAHMNQPPMVQPGEPVVCGQTIGEVGNTPPEWSSSPHLHLEGRVGPGGTSFPGMAYYTTSASPDEMESYQSWRMSGEFRMFDPTLLLEYGVLE